MAGERCALTPALAATCAMIAAAMADAREPWWIIASAAVALHGVHPGPIGDVDILMGEADARRIADTHGIPIAPGVSDGRFRSALFGRWDGAPLPVEIMAGFEVMGPDAWTPVAPLTRQMVRVGNGIVYVPERAELAALLRAFGRTKDVRRATLLEAQAIGNARPC